MTGIVVSLCFVIFSVHSGVIAGSKSAGTETYAELPVDPPVNQREVLSQVPGNL